MAGLHTLCPERDLQSLGSVLKINLGLARLQGRPGHMVIFQQAQGLANRRLLLEGRRLRGLLATTGIEASLTLCKNTICS